MKFGYMSSFKSSLFSEIIFAKKYFDFIEITLELDFSKYTRKFIEELINVLEGFEVVAHLHWEINLLKEDFESLEKIFKLIEIYKKIGANKITIHPTSDNKDYVFEKNLKSLLKINRYCRKRKIDLLIENSVYEPFNRSVYIKKLVTKIPGLGITLDIGHAKRCLELDNFIKLSKFIKHIHLHNNVGEKDHILFNNTEKLESLLSLINKTSYNKTITLEIFYDLVNNKSIPLPPLKRRELIINQLYLIKKIYRKLS